MKIIKLLLLFYCLQIVIVLGAVTLTTQLIMPVLVSPILWIVTAVFCFLGWLGAVIVYELKLRPVSKKVKIFRNGLIVSTVGFIAFLAFAALTAEEDKKERNSEANRLIMYHVVRDDEEHIRIAFARLESTFIDPDDIELDAFSVRGRDTLAENGRDSIFTIYFTYFLGQEKRDKYFSKVSVFRGIPEIQLYNLPTTTSEEYQKIKAEKENTEREMFRSIEEALRQIPDSVMPEKVREAISEPGRVKN